MLNILICDDDREQLASLEQLVHKACSLDCSVECTDDEYILADEIKEKQYDILILDIRLKRENGIDIADAVLKHNPQMLIIFISGYTEYYEEVYRANHIYFITKPVSPEKLKNSFDKAIEIIKSRENEKILMRTDQGVINIYMENIVYVESEGHNLKLHMLEDRIIKGYMCKLDSLEERLNVLKTNPFIRTHKSFLVNIKRIKRVEKKFIIIDDDTKIPISRKYSGHVNKVLTGYLGGIICI